MIQFQNVSKTYPGNEFSLGEVNFQVEEGEFVFLIGPSGSGKTTLIKLLIREENPTSGKIYLDDYDITKLSRSKVYQLRRQIGVIFQDYKLIPDKNSYENVAFAMEAAGRSNKDIKETVPYVLDIVGLSNRMGAFPDQLSGGEKQRVAIARAVANNPRVLIADEPTGNLDPGAAWDIVQILSKINNWGTTIIMSTHGTDIVNTLNKRVIQMRSGRVVRDDSKGQYEITSSPATESKNIDDLEKITESSRKRGPIQVTIEKPGEIEETPTEQRRGLFSWFSFGSGKSEVEGHPFILDQVSVQEELQEEVEEALEALAESANDPIDLTTQEIKEVIADADRTSVDELDLPEIVIADLKSAGYSDIEDVTSAGPAKLADELIIDPEEVVLVARAIEEFVEEETEKDERHKIKDETGEDERSKIKDLREDKNETEEDEIGKDERSKMKDLKENKKEEKVESSKNKEVSEGRESKAGKVKLDLTGKKSK